MAKRVKGVSFNDSDPVEQKMVDYADAINFSAYVKRLMYVDMFANQPQKVQEKLRSNASSVDRSVAEGFI